MKTLVSWNLFFAPSARALSALSVLRFSKFCPRFEALHAKTCNAWIQKHAFACRKTCIRMSKTFDACVENMQRMSKHSTHASKTCIANMHSHVKNMHSHVENPFSSKRLWRFLLRTLWFFPCSATFLIHFSGVSYSKVQQFNQKPPLGIQFEPTWTLFWVHWWRSNGVFPRLSITIQWGFLDFWMESRFSIENLTNLENTIFR